MPVRSDEAAPEIRITLFLLARDLLHRERDARGRHVGDHVDPVLVEPLAGDRGADVGLVLMVGADDLDLLAVHRAAEIGDRHLRRLDRARAAEIGIEAGHVGEHADLDRIAGDLRLSRRRQRKQRQPGRRVTVRSYLPLLKFRRPAARRRHQGRHLAGVCSLAMVTDLSLDRSGGIRSPVRDIVSDPEILVQLVEVPRQLGLRIMSMTWPCSTM